MWFGAHHLAGPGACEVVGDDLGPRGEETSKLVVPSRWRSVSSVPPIPGGTE